MRAAGAAQSARRRVRSLWLQQAGIDEQQIERQAGKTRVDVCVVGGGFTGLWTALRLRELEPAIDIAIVEADRCGAGASGRNGGFVLSLWSKFTTLRKQFGPEEALRIGRASATAVGEIGEWCEREQIDAHFRQDGWLWTATSAAQDGAWSPTVAELERYHVHPFEQLSAAEAAARAGSASHVGGVFESGAASIQPALLVRGLRESALSRGIRIWEATPMVGLKRTRPLQVITETGVVSADCVVLATNAWAAHYRELRRRLVVVASDVVATDAVPDRLAELNWRGLCISDSRLLVNYFRGTRDGRIVWGKAGGAIAFAGKIGDSFEGKSPRGAEVAESMRRLYPQIADLRIAASWTGPIDRSMTGIPFFGRLDNRPDLLVGTGYSGNGIGPSVLGGRILASLALEREDEWSQCGLVGLPPRDFPPEPVRHLGGRLVRSAVARKEAAEDAGLTARPIDRRLTSLAPAGLVPTNRDA